MPNDATWRKQRPLYSGVLQYFPDALLEVAHCSWVGNEQHNPGQRLHWAKEKSSDEADALIRHLNATEVYDVDGCMHLAKVAWRALALLQRALDTKRPPANLPGAAKEGGGEQLARETGGRGPTQESSV